jgi:hypothetical protein
MISTMHDSRWSVLINSSDDSKKRLSSCHLLSCNLQSLTVRVVASCCLCCRRQLPYLVVTSVQLISDFLSSGWTQVAVDKMTSFRCPNFGDVWALSNETLGIWFSIGYSLNLKVDLTVDSWQLTWHTQLTTFAIGKCHVSAQSSQAASLTLTHCDSSDSKWQILTHEKTPDTSVNVTSSQAASLTLTHCDSSDDKW